jgi:hypothetical protein
VHYYFQLAQQQGNESGATQSSNVAVTNPGVATVQVLQPGTGQIQAVAIANQSQEQVCKLVNELTVSSLRC